MSYTLPNLNYSYDALEPHIDAATMEIHHQKHHAAYVSKLNSALDNITDPSFNKDCLESVLSNLDSIPTEFKSAVQNNGGGHYNHSLFWESMCPNGGGDPSGEIKNLLENDFGSIDEFKSKFKNAALGQFGSGWAWLCLMDNNSLSICSTANQDNPIMSHVRCGKPILGIDVWEHAYYLKYQNKRPDYIDAWWHVINWDIINKRIS